MRRPQNSYVDISRAPVDLPFIHVVLPGRKNAQGDVVEAGINIKCEKMTFCFKNNSQTFTLTRAKDQGQEVKKLWKLPHPKSNRPQNITMDDYFLLLEALKRLALEIHIPETIPQQDHESIIKRTLGWSNSAPYSYDDLKVTEVTAQCREIDFDVAIDQNSQIDGKVIPLANMKSTMRRLLSKDRRFITLNSEFFTGRSSHLTNTGLVELINRRYQCPNLEPNCFPPQTTKMYNFNPSTSEMPFSNGGLITTLNPQGENLSNYSPMAAFISLIPIFLIFLAIYKYCEKKRKKKGAPGDKNSMPLLSVRAVDKQLRSSNNFYNDHIKQILQHITSLLAALDDFLRCSSLNAKFHDLKEPLNNATQYRDKLNNNDNNNNVTTPADECKQWLEQCKRPLEKLSKEGDLDSKLLLLVVSDLTQNCSLLMPNYVTPRRLQDQREQLKNWLETELDKFSERKYEQHFDKLLNCLKEELNTLQGNHKEDDTAAQYRQPHSQTGGFSPSIFSGNSSNDHSNLTDEVRMEVAVATI